MTLIFHSSDEFIFWDLNRTEILNLCHLLLQDKIKVSKYTFTFNKGGFYHMHTEFQHMFSKLHSLTDKPKCWTALMFTSVIHTADVGKLHKMG